MSEDGENVEETNPDIAFTTKEDDYNHEPTGVTEKCEETDEDNIVNEDDDPNNQDESQTQKSFKERALELMKKCQGEHSHLVQRKLQTADWIVIHRIIRKSKGLKSKYMIRNLNPMLFEPHQVTGWKCKFCQELIPAPVENYVSHLMTHGFQSDDDPLFPCDVCGDYVKRDKYVVHWVPHFMEHECPLCHKSFALNCHMKYHYKVVHEEGEQTCLQCGKLMKNDLAMRRHLRLFHSNRTTWKICDVCGKRVKSRCLEPHKLTHSQDRPYKCDICKKCFKTPSTLYQHQKVHATDSKAHKYLCEYCGKRFKHHTSWNLHVVRIHEGEYEHECPVCNKRFHKLFELKKHSVKHSEDRPFPCSVCGKQFKTKTHLKEHLTTHSEEKSHICPLCGKGIRMKANLYKHLKVHRNRGEYVPPLNGSSTNALFNNFGTASSSSNFQSSTKTSSSSTNASSQAQTDQSQFVSQDSNLEIMSALNLHADVPTEIVQLTTPVNLNSTMATEDPENDNDVEITLPATILPDGSLMISSESVPARSLLGTQSSNATHFVIINSGESADAGVNCNKSAVQSAIATLDNNDSHSQTNGGTVSDASPSIVLPAATTHLPASSIVSFITQNGTGNTQGGPVTHLTILLSNGPIGGITLGQ